LEGQIDEIDEELHGTTDGKWIDIKSMATGVEPDAAITRNGGVRTNSWVIPSESGTPTFYFNLNGISKVRIQNLAYFNSQYKTYFFATRYITDIGTNLSPYVDLIHSSNASVEDEIIDVPDGDNMLVVCALNLNDVKIYGYVSEEKQSVIEKVTSENFENALTSAAVINGGTAYAWVDVTDRIGVGGVFADYGVAYPLATSVGAYNKTKVNYGANSRGVVVFTHGAKAIRVTGNIESANSPNFCRLYAAFSSINTTLPTASNPDYLPYDDFLGLYSDKTVAVGNTRGAYNGIEQELGDDVQSFFFFVDNISNLVNYKVELYMETTYEGIINEGIDDLITVGDSVMGCLDHVMYNDHINYEMNIKRYSRGSETILANLAEANLIPVNLMPFSMSDSDIVQEVAWASDFGWTPNIVVNKDSGGNVIWENETIRCKSVTGDITYPVSYKRNMECFFVGAENGFDTYGIRVKFPAYVDGELTEVVGTLMSLGGYTIDSYGNYVYDETIPTSHYFKPDTPANITIYQPTPVYGFGINRLTGVPVLMNENAEKRKFIVFSAQNGGYYYYDDYGNWDYENHDDTSYFDTEDAAYRAMRNLIAIHRRAYQACNGNMIIIGHQFSADGAHNPYFSYIRDKYDALMKQEFGRKFISSREVLFNVANIVGREAAQMTTNDLIYLGMQQTPCYLGASSASDEGNTHLNKLGSCALANEVYRRMYEIGWLKHEPKLYDLKSIYDELVAAGTIHVNS
jgi:hypothetical protein